MAESNTIAPGKYVAIAYELFTIDPATGESTQVHSVGADEPESFVYGITPGLSEGLAEGLAGLSEGDRFDISVPAEKGFAYSPDQVVALPRGIFLDEEGKFDSRRVKVGATLPMNTAGGVTIPGVVTAIGPDTVTMDFNHPLVGYDLRFKGTVVAVHDATPEELRPYMGGCGGGCCGGCGHDNGGNCGGGGCNCEGGCGC